MVEHLICNEVVGGSSPFASSVVTAGFGRRDARPSAGHQQEGPHRFPSAQADAGGGVEGCPSGQREQTVNLPAYAFEGSNPSPSTIPKPPQDLSGNSSAARASAFQAEGRGFESRFPLHSSPTTPASRPGALLGRARRSRLTPKT